MLNTTQYIVLAGNPKPWDDATTRRVDGGEDLTAIQEDQYAKGRLSMQLVHCGHGWGVRPASSLMLPYQIGDNNIRMLHLEAIKLGMEWAYEDEVNREFFARTSDLQPGWKGFVRDLDYWHDVHRNG